MDDEGHRLDPERQRRARQYAAVRRRLSLLELAASAAYLTLWLAFGWTHSAQSAWRSVLPGVAGWLEPALMALAVGLPWMIVTFPLDYYIGFVLPHRYELSTQTIAGWLTDQAKGLAVSAALGIPLLVGLYGLMRWTPDAWWLGAATGYALVTTVLAVLSPVLLLPLFYNLQPLGQEHEGLRQRLLGLARTAGARIEGVYQFNMSRRTKAANAALTGLGRTRRILLGDTLLASFSDDEIETVLAHELAHHVHGDIPLSLLVGTGLSLGGFYLVAIGLDQLGGGVGLTSAADPAGLPLLALLFGAFGLLTMPLGNAFSRWRERLADEMALNLTHKPVAFARAMTRLANQNLADADPPRWVVWLLSSHPPLRDRIARAEQMQSM